MDRRTVKFIASTRFFVATFLASLLLIQPSFADQNGRAGDSGAVTGRDCGRCHTGAAIPTVSLTGPQSVTVNSVNTYSFSLMGGPAMTAGLGVSASGGTLSATMAGTSMIGAEVVHSTPTPMVSGAVNYTFDWQAPATNGTFTLYASGTSTNDLNNTGGDGSANATLVITVTGAANQAPIARITGPTSGVAGTQITFSGASSTDPDGTIAQYDWNFGDGSAGSGVTASRAFAAGTYTVTLTVTDAQGMTGSASVSVTVVPSTSAAPISVVGGPYSGMAGAPIQFDGSRSAAPPAGTISTYDWAFGDGGTATGPNPTYTYAAAGTYTVILTVTDDKNARASSVTVATVGAAVAGSEGADLYAENCESCHGPDGVGGPDGDVVGEDAEDIMEAIEEYPEMNFLADVLSPEDIDAIALFLTPAAIGEGADLYAANCESCHGPDGVGGPDGDVVGEDAEDIMEAIEEYPEMNFLADVLSPEDIEAIGAFLTSLEEEEDEEAEEESIAIQNRGGDSGNTTASNHQIARTATLDTLSMLALVATWLAAGAARRRRR